MDHLNHYTITKHSEIIYVELQAKTSSKSESPTDDVGENSEVDGTEPVGK